ncbi:hypothetical protein BPLS_P3865 [Bathymodiolus platifrons methanotrophic gill symbiont]|uniref:AbiU2 domain-containing protein n=1 Tax=Bathymodiolus platifrons methanotrophic gill symbiont TaxID=113268 RepID=UPI001B72B768|nr:hypothetical protein [Bathymodiolus platifrons methanotrophic gill symbiont]GFO76218.1 hypothetical protein BPLS_P3865 [Bathymodiolus platifrons methanotrophic gill symbiont]
MKESVVKDKTIEVKSNEDALANLKEDFTYFRDHCIDIRRDFNTYHNLFHPDNFDLLEKISGTFFREINSILIRHWIIGVCNLVDRESTKVKGETCENISINLINAQIKKQFDGDKWRKQIDSITTLTTNITDYGKNLSPARNKFIAHSDKNTYKKGLVLGKTSEKDPDNFIENIQEYCDLVGNLIGVGALDFRCSSCQGDVLDFVCFLSDVKEMLLPTNEDDQQILFANLKDKLSQE